MARSSEALGRSASAAWRTYQRSGAPHCSDQPSASKEGCSRSNSVRDSASVSASAAGSTSAIWSLPTCQCTGVSRPQGAPLVSSSARRPSSAALAAAQGQRPSAPDQPCASASTRSCGALRVYSSSSGRAGVPPCGASRPSRASRFGRRSAFSAARLAAEAALAWAISRWGRAGAWSGMAGGLSDPLERAREKFAVMACPGVCPPGALVSGYRFVTYDFSI